MFIVLGIIVAVVLGNKRYEARGGRPGVITDIAIWAVPFGIVGGRIYHVLSDWQIYFGAEGAGFVAALRIWDGGFGYLGRGCIRRCWDLDRCSAKWSRIASGG